MRKLIVMGGSFNPPTMAHRRLLLGAVKALGADRGIFVPSSHAYVSIKMRRARLPKEVLREEVRLRPDWEQVKVGIMEELVRASSPRTRT